MEGHKINIIKPDYNISGGDIDDINGDKTDYSRNPETPFRDNVTTVEGVVILNKVFQIDRD